MLKIYLFAPFIFSFLFSILTPLKNPIYSRALFYFCAFFQLVLSFCTFFIKEENFSILNITLNNSGFNVLFSFLLSFILFLYAILSKTFITKLQRVNSSITFLLFATVNLSLFCNNIFVFAILLFWFCLLKYFISCLWCKKEDRRNFRIDLCIDIFILLIFMLLLGWDFCRYFVVNNIPFDFLNIEENISNVSDTSTICAFWGFLILGARLFNLIPFSSKEFLTSKTNSLVSFYNCISSLIIADSLLIKIYSNFDYLFYQYQNIIVAYLIFNLFYFCILSLHQSNAFKFLKNSLTIFTITSVFPLFAFSEDAVGIFGYYVFVLGICLCFCFFVVAILTNKFKSDNLEDFKKIDDKTKLIHFFVIISFLALAKVPPGAFFSANLFSFTTIFALDFDGIILNLAPYCFLLGGFLSCLAYYNMIYKILIETNIKESTKISLSRHQILALGIILFALIAISICPRYIFESSGLL